MFPYIYFSTKAIKKQIPIDLKSMRDEITPIDLKSMRDEITPIDKSMRDKITPIVSDKKNVTQKVFPLELRQDEIDSDLMNSDRNSVQFQIIMSNIRKENNKK